MCQKLAKNSIRGPHWGTVGATIVIADAHLVARSSVLGFYFMSNVSK
jgi:hypothetical protein